MQVNVEFLGWSCHGKLLFRYRVLFRYAGKCYIPCVPIRDPAEGKREHAESPVRAFFRRSLLLLLLLPLFLRYSSVILPLPYQEFRCDVIHSYMRSVGTYIYIYMCCCVYGLMLTWIR